MSTFAKYGVADKRKLRRMLKHGIARADKCSVKGAHAAYRACKDKHESKEWPRLCANLLK